MVNRRLLVAALLVAAALLVTQLLPAAVQDELRYERDALSRGEAWRWLSAHFVHLDLRHAILNAAAAAVLAILLGPALSARAWAATVFAAVVGVDAGLWFFSPEISWYVGASGVLHGLIAAGGIALLRQRDWRGGVLLILLAGKLSYEQLTTNGLGFTGELPVVVDAHLYGAVAGAIGYLLTRRTGQIRI